MSTMEIGTRKRKITDFVLFCLEKSVDGYVRFEDFTYHHYRYQYGIPELKKSSLSQALKRLREGGFIEYLSDEKLIYRLTDKGKDRAVWASIKDDSQKWDKKWRLVIFDVPEKRRAARDLLRSKLKQWEFIKFQKSVWGTKKNCTKPLRDFIKNVGIEDWVMVVEASDIGF